MIYEKNEIIKDKIFKNQKVCDYTAFGLGVVKIDGFSIFLEDVLKDEIVDFKIKSLKKSYGFGKLIRIIKKSDNRILPTCPYYNICNGCNFLHMNYDEQKKFKINELKSKFKRSNLINMDQLDNIRFEFADKHFKYRNKVTMYFFNDKNNLDLGYFSKVKNSFIGINDCLLQDDIMNEMKNELLKLLNKTSEKAYSQEDYSGNLKSIVIRKIDEKYMIIVIAKESTDVLKNALKELQVQYDLLKGIYISINKEKRSNLITNNLINISEEDDMIETLKNKKYKISPSAFFQINKDQTIKLYDTVLGSTDFSKKKVLDAYCGTGTIGLYIADNISRGIGIEINKQAIQDANINKKLNNIKQMQFISQDLEKEIYSIDDDIDIVIVDPPRKGLSKKFKNNLNIIDPKEIIYISCSLSSLILDLKELEKKYKIDNITGVDMFIQTYHIETVIKLTKRG